VNSDVFVSQTGRQTIVREKNGRFVRKLDFQDQHFNSNGKLTSIRYNNEYYIDLTYNKNGTIDVIKDKFSKQIFFSWTSNGQVECVWNKEENKSCYKYKNRDLVESLDVNKYKFLYAYDSSHNMTKISYSDGSTKEMKYDPKTLNVSQVKDRNGEITVYKYGRDSKAPDLHFWVDVTKTYPASEGSKSYSVGPNRYEYQFARNSRGDLITKFIASKTYGVEKVTTYHEECGLPLSIKVGSEETTFKYDPKCLLVEKMSSDNKEFTKIEYNKENKISKVINSEGEHNYRYDNKGNLLQVTFKGSMEAEEGATLTTANINIAYDHLGQIVKINESKSYAGGDRKPSSTANLTFAYSSGKPVEIVSDGVGKLTIQYDLYGNITNINSGSATSVSLSIAKTLQLLTRLVKPSGVDFNL
jgi:hypothetical protein